jgi:hypothetical protein
MPADENSLGLTAEWLEAFGYPEGIPASLGMIDFWETSCIDELMWGQTTAVALFFARKQHCLLSGYALDLGKLDRVRRDFQVFGEVVPNEALESIVPFARAIQTTCAVHSTCDCVRTAAGDMVEAIEAILRPRQAQQPRRTLQ